VAIVVVGGGAIGLQVAGRLALGGVECALLARPSGVAALTATPLRLALPDGMREVRVAAAAEPDELPAPCRRPDLAVLCVKGYDTVGAIATLRRLEPRLILTLQNGIGNEERLAEAFGAPRVIAGAITTSVETRGPSEIVVTKAGGVGLSALDPATDLAPWAAAFRAAVFPVKLYSDHRAMKWSKALLNMLGNAQAAILDMTVPQIYADARLLDLDIRAAREALAVMATMGARPVNLPGYPAATVATLARFTPDALLRPLLRRLVGGGRGGKDPSLLRDLRAGRTRSEGEQLYGAVATEAAARGVPAPVNAALWRILGGIVRGETPWEAYRGKPERLLQEIRGNLVSPGLS
jgi:2-dehydropantoate 2-reductase